MSSQLKLQDQIRESMRGPRILGELWDYQVVSSSGERENLRFEQVYKKESESPISQIPSIENWEFVSPTDPFSLSLRDFLMLDLNEARDLLIKVYDLCKNLLKEAWGRGVRQVVICDGKIVFENIDIEDISNETVERLAQKYDKACYVFSAPDAVEESTWTLVDDRDNDYYPTLCVYLGMEDSDELEIVESSSPIYPDLDTGNPIYKIFYASQLVESLTKFTPLQMQHGEHLGQTYIYFRKKVKMCVRAINGNINSIVCDVSLIRDGEGSALLQASPNRTGFIGRDVLRKLGIRLELDPLKKITRILDVS